MKPWKVIALLTLPMLLFAAWRIWSIYKERHAPVAVKQDRRNARLLRMIW